MQVQEARANPLKLLCDYNGVDSDHSLSSKVYPSIFLVAAQPATTTLYSVVVQPRARQLACLIVLHARTRR
jgi:hypothetical protein